MRKIVGLVVSLCLLCFSAAAQDVIRGTVVDQNGEAIIGAGIVVKGAPGRPPMQRGKILTVITMPPATMTGDSTRPVAEVLRYP